MPKILENEALALAQGIESLPPDQQAQAADVLRRYREQQHDLGEPDWPSQEQAAQESEGRFRALFDDLKNVDNQSPSFTQGLRFSTDPDADRARVAGTAFLSRVYQKQPEEVSRMFPLLRDDYLNKRGQKTGLDDRAFYSFAQGEVKRMTAREKAALEGAKAALRGEDSGKALAAWQAANPDFGKEDSGFFSSGFNKAMEEDGDSLPVAANLLSLLESGSFKSKDGKAVSTPFTDEQAAQLGNMVEQLAGMKPRRRKSIYRAMNARIEAAGYDQKGFWAQMLSELDRGLYRASTTLGTQAGVLGDVMEAQANASQRSVDFSMDGGGGFSTPVLSVEEQQQLQRQRDFREQVGNVQAELQDIVAGRLDPVKPTVSWLNDTLETGMIKGPGAIAPFMAASAALGPWGAGILFTADFAEHNRRDLVRMGMDADQARQIGAAAAPVQAAVESLSNMLSLGKFPAVQAFFQRFTKPVAGVSLLGRYAQNTALSLGTELTEELIQDNFVVPFAQELLSKLESDIPQVDWKFYKDRAWNSIPELTAALLPMALVFGGFMTAADAKLSERSTRDIDYLKNVGFDQAQAVDVASQPTANERIKRAASLWSQRKGDKLSMEEAGKRLSAQYRELAEDTAKNLAELEQRGKLPRMLPMQGGGYRVTYNDGSVADFQNYQEASSARWFWFRDQLGKEAALMRQSLESLEKNLERGRELAVEISPEAMPVDEAKKRGIISDAQVQERLQQAAVLDEGVMMGDAITLGKMEGNEEEVQLLLGMSKNQWFDPQGQRIAVGNFKNDVLRTTVKLWDGAGVFTLVEEKTEGDAKLLLSSGKRDWMLERLRAYEQASGDRLFRFEDDDKLNNKDLIEAWSHVAQAYLIVGKEKATGRSFRRYLRNVEEAGLTAAMNAQAIEWQAVVNRAQKLGELKKAGKLGEDLAAELERQLGIDSQVVHEQGAIKEAQQVAQDVAQQVDTSGYSEANPGPNGETFSLSVQARGGVPFKAGDRVASVAFEATVYSVERSLSGTGYWVVYTDVSRGPQWVGGERIKLAPFAKPFDADTEPVRVLQRGNASTILSRSAELDALKEQKIRPETKTGSLPISQSLTGNDEYKAPDSFGPKAGTIKKGDWLDFDGPREVTGVENLFGGDVWITFGKFAARFSQDSRLKRARAIPADASKVVQMPDGARLVGPTTFSIRAFHGTPHKVDKFSLSKIGTGEGAQAYGWGLYFAENEAVAAEYRQKLSSPVDKAVRGDGAVTVSRDYVVALAQYAIGEAMGKTKEESIARAMRMAPNLGLSIDETELARLVDAGTKWQREIGGNLYTVELLPDADEFLDWDKPLSEQSEKVQKGIRELLDIYKDVAPNDFKNYLDGAPAASWYVQFMPSGSPEGVSRDLAAVGIKGIRYLDGGSRGAGDGTRNYVIFDENLVRILEENGKPVENGQTFSIAPSALSVKPPKGVIANKTDALPSWTLPKSEGSVSKVLNSPKVRAEFYAKLDKAIEWLRADPAQITTAKGWVTFMRKAGVWGEIPMPPSGLADIIADPATYVAKLNGGYHGEASLSDTQTSAKQGMDGTVEMRKLIGEGKAPAPFVVALHNMWGILSRMLSPIDQEGMWLRLIAHRPVLDAIQASIDGKFSMTVAQWKQVVQDARASSAVESGPIGNAATSNANDFYLMLSRLNGRWNDMADVYAAPNSREMGRRFWNIGAGKLGIKNKVQRFIGLTFGTPGVIMDRWKFVEFWLPTAMEGMQANEPSSYFNYSANTPSDPVGVYGIYGGIDSENEALSLAMYEAFEVVLEESIAKSQELQDHLGEHANAGGMHWFGWNAIKNEAVGHSSLDLTKELIATFGLDIDAEKVHNTVRNGTYYTEGSPSAGNTVKFVLERGKVRVERTTMAGGLQPGRAGRNTRGAGSRVAEGRTGTIEAIGETFSLRPGDFASRVEAMFSPFQRSPEARLVMARVAKDRALRLGNELIDKANVIRTIGSIDREARVRAALAEDKAVQDYLDSLTPAARQTLEWEPSDLKDDPLIAAMLDFGKLMSKTTALQRGKVDLKMGDFDGAPWLPPSFYSKGSGIMPDQMAQAMFDAGLLPDAYTDTLWAELGKRIEASRKDKTAHREAVQAFKDAKKAASQKATQEAQAWADNAKKQAGSGKAQRDRIKAWLRVLDGILAAAPPEVRARVGGFVKMAGIATDEAALRYLEDRVAKLDKELDKWLKKEGLKSLDKLFKKAAADYTAGKKAKGKIGPDEHYLLQRAEAASEMDASTLVGELAKLDALATDDNLTAEQQAMAELERGILELVGNIREADAGRIFSAFDALSGIYQRGVMEWKAKQIARREQREAVRSELKADTGKTGTGKERRETEERMATGFGKLKSGWLSVSSFSEVLDFSFGSKSKQKIALVDGERESSNTYEDEQQGIAEELEALFTDMAGTGKVLDGEKLRFDMAQRTIEAGDLKLSQFEAISALLMWRQEDGRRHMEGTFDENNKRTSSWGYDQAWVDEVQKQLSNEGRRFMAWLSVKYANEWAELNPLYRERHGVNLPQHDNYAPILVKPMQAKAGEMVDPVSGAAVSGSILTPGSLRTRSRNAIAEPDFRDALQTFIAHKKQMGYWKAYYDLAVEAQAVLGNRELMNSVEAKAGKEAVSVIRKWLDVFAQGGVRDAAAGLAVTKWLGNMTNRAATMGLLGRVTTLLVQSTQLAAASVKMPVGAYLKRFGKLLAGQLDWSGAINSDFIQRRIKSAPPIVRQAMEGLGTATKPNQVKRLVRSLGNLLSGADGLFTGGTYAILLDYHREQGATLGLKGAELEEYAHTEAERATEEVAQPTRTGNRSLAELTATNPLAKVGWAYASEARQKVALFGWALESGDVARISKTAFLVFGIGGVLSQVLKNLWKEARGDDDEKMWSGDRMLWAALSPVTAGIPGLSLIMGEGNAWSNVKWAPSALADIVTLQGDLRDFNTVLAAAGLMNDTAAGIAALSNAGLDFAKLVENLFGGSSSE